MDGGSRGNPGPAAVAAVVTARRPSGVELQLRYELEVVRSDRWYVRSIGTDPVDKGGLW